MNNRGLIIAVDFDGTLCKSIWPGLGPPNAQLIRKLLALQSKGARLILWTCREGTKLEDALKWCEEYGLVFDAVNDNLPEMKGLYAGNSRKICCDYYIDDKSCLPETFCRKNILGKQ